jgi:hypothetical protein
MAATGGMVNGTLTLVVPSPWALPSPIATDPTYTTSSQGTLTLAGRTITVSGINLDSGQTLTITYGDKSGLGPGATAPSTAGDYAWLTKQRSNRNGTLLPLASSPIISVTP